MSYYSRLSTLSAEMALDCTDERGEMPSSSPNSDIKSEEISDDENAPLPLPQPPKVARSQPVNIDPLINKICKLLFLFERILNEEWTDLEGVEVKYPELPLEADFEGLTCDFCGADIFESFFECKNVMCFSRENGDRESVTLCAGCYVEGRSCTCEIMTPTQRLPLQQLVDLQKSVAMMTSPLLKGLSWKPVPWSPQSVHYYLFA